MPLKRLDKLITDTGICSRSQARDRIRAGAVTVDGTVIRDAAAKFDSDVSISFQGKTIDGKSILQVMMACIPCGSQIELQCSGPDEEAMLQAAGELIRSGLEDEIV